MAFLYILEDLRQPLLNELMLLITKFGEETVFLVIGLIVFWCVSKRCGYYILGVGFIGTLANQFMKLFFRVPRPWVLDDNFTILEQAREAAGGYSFPSGHTQSAVGTFGCLASISKVSWVRYAAISIAVLVPFSRMYIGVHTPLDVIVAALIAVALVIVIKPVVFAEDGRYIPLLLGGMAILAILFMCYVELFPFPPDIDLHNLEAGITNAYTLFGSLIGLIVVYIVDEKWLNFSTKANFWGQVFKVILGLMLVLAVKSGLKTPLNFLLGELFGRAMRYFLVVITSGVVWPLSFKWFEKIDCKEK